MRMGSPQAWPRRPSTVGPDHGRPAPGRRGYDGWWGRRGPRTGAWTPAVGGGMPKMSSAVIRRRVHVRCWVCQVPDACSRVSYRQRADASSGAGRDALTRCRGRPMHSRARPVVLGWHRLRGREDRVHHGRGERDGHGQLPAWYCWCCTSKDFP